MNQGSQHFGLRKFSFGLASVLLGTTFYLGGTNVAHADVLVNSANSLLNTQENTGSETTTNNVVKPYSASAGASAVAASQNVENAQAQSTGRVTEPVTSQNTVNQHLIQVMELVKR